MNPPDKEDGRRSDATLLGVIDERTRHLSEAIKGLGEALQDMRQDVITRSEFDAKLRPVQMAVYGFVALVLTGVVGALLAQVFK